MMDSARTIAARKPVCTRAVGGGVLHADCWNRGGTLSARTSTGGVCSARIADTADLQNSVSTMRRGVHSARIAANWTRCCAWAAEAAGRAAGLPDIPKGGAAGAQGRGYLQYVDQNNILFAVRPCTGERISGHCALCAAMGYSRSPYETIRVAQEYSSRSSGRNPATSVPR